MVKDVAPISSLGLDELARMPYAELASRYATGTVPRSLVALDGPLVGRMLAVRWTRAMAPLLRWWASSSRFVWAGKTWRALDDQSGTGINRIQLAGLLGQQDLFPFATRFGPSLVDGAPAVILDYSSPKNPPYIRRIHDEVRQVEPGLFLGPAMWKRGTGASTVLWFALDTRSPS
jgi:hypothetical protein